MLHRPAVVLAIVRHCHIVVGPRSDGNKNACFRNQLARFRSCFARIGICHARVALIQHASNMSSMLHHMFFVQTDFKKKKTTWQLHALEISDANTKTISHF